MPETFGSGTAFSAFDPRVKPLTFLGFAVPFGGSLAIAFDPDNVLSVVTAIDLVSQGSGISGEAIWTYFDGTDHFPFWVANIGGGSDDTFSWRGWLVFGGATASDLEIENTSGGNLSGVISGFEVPYIPEGP